jgi:hypothetical protein
MKRPFKLAALAAFIAAAAMTSHAQTNRVANLGFQLVFYSQGATTTNGTRVVEDADVTRFGTKDLIQILGAATSNDFSRAARLLRVTAIIDGTNGGTTTIVKDGTNVVDVTGFFSTALDGVVVHDSTFINGRLLKATRYSIRNLALKDKTGFPALAAHFAVQGFDVADFHRAEPMKAGSDMDDHGDHDATWTVNGTGDHNGQPIVVKGEINVNFIRIVVGPGF